MDPKEACFLGGQGVDKICSLEPSSEVSTLKEDLGLFLVPSTGRRIWAHTIRHHLTNSSNARGPSFKYPAADGISSR